MTEREVPEQDPVQLARDEFDRALSGTDPRVLPGQLNGLQKALLGSSREALDVYKELISSSGRAISRAKGLKDKAAVNSLETAKKGFEKLAEAFRPLPPLKQAAPTSTEGKSMSSPKQ